MMILLCWAIALSHVFYYLSHDTIASYLHIKKSSFVLSISMFFCAIIVWVSRLFMFLAITKHFYWQCSTPVYPSCRDISGLKVAPSNIHGNGVFVTDFSDAGVCLFEAVSLSTTNSLLLEPWYLYSNPVMTDLGRKINHKRVANSILVGSLTSNGFSIYTIKSLQPGEEVLIDYMRTPWFILPPAPWWL